FVLGVWRPGAEVAADESAGLAQRLAAFEHLLIDNALRDCGGDVAAAAEHLAVPRKTLYDKIARFGIDMAAYRGAEARP
ncbi:helix-turn-helix domain-containing protein, partial [Thauera sp.]